MPNLADALAVARDLGASTPFGTPTGGPLTLHCPSGKVAALADALRRLGADTVAVGRVDWVFTASNEMGDALDAALG